MRYKFQLRNIETGETCLYADIHDYEEEYRMLCQWLEGNFSCDCNRSLFLYSQEKELPCNNGENTIVVDKIVREDGTDVQYNIEDWE